MPSISMKIAGASFRDQGLEAVKAVPVGSCYELVREPQNPHDRHAVRVLSPKMSVLHFPAQIWDLGYIPRRWSKTVAAAMENPDLIVWAVKQDAQWGSITVDWTRYDADPL